DDLLIGPAGDDPIGAFRSDASHFAQPTRLLVDNVEYSLPKGANQLLGVDRSDTADHAGAEIFLDAFDRCRCGSLEEGRAELHTMGMVVDPGPTRLDELAGRDHRRVPDNGDQITLTSRLDAQHAEAVFRVVERDAVD